MILAVSLAWADAPALRNVDLGGGVGFAGSTRGASVAAWIGPETGLSLSVGRGAVAGLVATRHRFVDGRWALVGGAAIGPSWLFLDSRLGVATSSYLAVEKVWTHAFFQVDVAAPVAVALTGGLDVAVPLRLEIGGGWVGSQAALGLKVGVGTTLAPGVFASLDGTVNLVGQLGRRRP